MSCHNPVIGWFKHICYWFHQNVMFNSLKSSQLLGFELIMYIVMVHFTWIELMMLHLQPLTLHTLLMVPEGRDITVEGHQPRRHGDKHPSLPPQPIVTGRLH